jgi:hypothetical protein
MHLNKRGKERLNKSLATLITKLVINKGRDTPKIALKWEDDSEINQDPEIHMTSMSPPDQSNNTNNEIQIETLHTETIIPRSSNRQKRLPITRNKVFFYGNSNFTQPHTSIPPINKRK